MGCKYVYNTVDIHVFLWHYSLMNPTKSTFTVQLLIDAKILNINSVWFIHSDQKHVGVWGTCNA